MSQFDITMGAGGGCDDTLERICSRGKYDSKPKSAMKTMYEYSERGPYIYQRQVINLGRKMATVIISGEQRRYEHNGRFRDTFDAAKTALLEELTKDRDNWKKYLDRANEKLAAAASLRENA